MTHTQLLIIDAQNDFCDYPSNGYQPALPVPGAYQDFLRLSRLIRLAGTGISQVIATLDTHHAIDLAHNTCWRDENGKIPPPFALVSITGLLAGRYRLAPGLASQDASEYVLQYLQNLEQLGRPFTLWPPHCLIGSPGNNLNAELAMALRDWEAQHFTPVSVIQKGENIWTENFSALKAVIPYPGDPTTDLNQPLLNMLLESDNILVAGQASSHCVKETVEDILRFGSPEIKNKLIMLTDCMSPVPGFETSTAKFLGDLQWQGVRLASSEEIVSELIADSQNS